MNLMKKKKEKKEAVEKEIASPKELEPISPVTVDFGRADLNQLRDVLNQIIARS